MGREWPPGAVFVLDRYYKNKAITAMTAGQGDEEIREAFESALRKALNSEDVALFTQNAPIS